MKLINYFKSFLDNEVNLNSARITTLDDRTEIITDLLSESDKFKDNFIDVIPQGSYAHKTIIKPVKATHEFDADILLYLKEYPEWEAKDYVHELYQFFRDNSTYREKVSRKTRCVTIKYANDFHIDVVPFLERHGQKFVTNRHENNFELTDPEKYTEWLDERNRITKHHFVKVIRLIKYIRDYKQTFAIKSIILNTLVGEQVNDAALLEDENCYSDVPTTLYTVMKKLKAYVHDHEYMPTIADPGETGENFGDRWNQDGWAVFRTKMIYYSDKITEAYDETDKEKSLVKWQEIFGECFKKPKTKTEEQQNAASRSLVSYNNTEQQITELGFPLRINPIYKVRLTGRVNKKTGHRHYDLATQGNKVGRGRWITFTVTNVNIPQPYAIYWKTLNRGEHAIASNCIRGQINEGGVTHQEPTSFKGNHFVECYIVKDGICVAKDRQSVIIT
ncbi:nucleotidyltransferase [Mucilaginibacter sp. HME9299]|uniref:Nucleotidyltransferase n=1 Tax=Mucilaginibacter aquatilis TaxID=1517760 RepID=A0A6I4I8M6_9SPHI|nr:nucleotidyltransferase [Mucilaginibacter aquatilis]